MGFLAHYELAVVACVYNPNTLEAEAKTIQNFKVILNYIFGFRLTWTSKTLT